MTRLSMIALGTALALSAMSPVAFAQGTVGTTVDGTVQTDTNVSGEAGGVAGGNAEVDAEVAVDANVEGTVNVADSNGDGTISAEEQANADTATAAGMATSMTCDESGLKSQIDSTATLDAAALAAVTSAIVVRVSDCEASDVSSAQASGSAEAIRTAMEANSVISSAVQGLGATPADVIGGMLTETMLTVYVEATP